jgi:hypothetical protein
MSPFLYHEVAAIIREINAIITRKIRLKKSCATQSLLSAMSCSLYKSLSDILAGCQLSDNRHVLVGQLAQNKVDYYFERR